jgi:peptide-methionine (R)-S-oxide reductase
MKMISMTPIDRRALLAGGTLAGVGLLLAYGTAGESKAATRYAVTMSDSQWRTKLGAARFQILRQEGTERAFTSPLLKEHRKGVFVCAGCNQALYSSATKFDSGTGWPSFYAALPGATARRADVSLGMQRIEEHCGRCGGHLGHVFDDGPPPTGKRHCINGLSLNFRPA